MAQLKRHRRNPKSNMTETVFLRVSPEAKARIGQLTDRLRLGASAIIDQIFTTQSEEAIKLVVDAFTVRLGPSSPSSAAVAHVRAAKRARELAPRKRPNQGKGARRG